MTAIGPTDDREHTGGSPVAHAEKLRALRAEIDKGIASLDAGQGKESTIADFLRHKKRGTNVFNSHRSQAR